MPNCFALARKIDPKTPIKFMQIDEEMCAFFGVPIHPSKYYYGWYDWMGLALACGSSFEDMRGRATDERTLAIINFIDERFTSDVWYTPRRLMNNGEDS